MASIIQPPNAAMNARRSSVARPRVHCVMTHPPYADNIGGPGPSRASLRGAGERTAAISLTQCASSAGDRFAAHAMTHFWPAALSPQTLGELVEVAGHDVERAGGHLVRLALGAPFERARDIAGAQALLRRRGEVVGMRRHQHHLWRLKAEQRRWHEIGLRV